MCVQNLLIHEWRLVYRGHRIDTAAQIRNHYTWTVILFNHSGNIRHSSWQEFYIPPQVNVKHKIFFNPDSLYIILGDFEKAKLTHELPKYRQHINCPTRENNTGSLMHNYFKDAYCSVPQTALGHSDHCLVHLIPSYRQKLKSAKPVVKTVKRCTSKAGTTGLPWLGCFWSCNWQDELTDTVTSVFVKTYVWQPKPYIAHVTTRSCGSKLDWNNFVRPRRMHTEVGTGPCISRPGTFSEIFSVLFWWTGAKHRHWLTVI